MTHGRTPWIRRCRGSGDRSGPESAVDPGPGPISMFLWLWTTRPSALLSAPGAGVGVDGRRVRVELLGVGDDALGIPGAVVLGVGVLVDVLVHVLVGVAGAFRVALAGLPDELLAERRARLPHPAVEDLHEGVTGEVGADFLHRLDEDVGAEPLALRHVVGQALVVGGVLALEGDVVGAPQLVGGVGVVPTWGVGRVLADQTADDLEGHVVAADAHRRP